MTTPNERRFRVEARTLLHLGRDSIKDPVTAVIELVKNSYDADATVVLIELATVPTAGEPNSAARALRVPDLLSAGFGLMTVTDNGAGMSESDLVDKWLVIGSSAKQVAPLSPINRRRVTGEKGIGRLSCDRLGPGLEVRSRKTGSDPIGVWLDWREFEQSGRVLSDVLVPDLDDYEMLRPDNWPRDADFATGTQLVVLALRTQWTASRLTALYRELSTLLPPWDDVSDFRIFLDSDVPGAPRGQVETSVDLAAEVDLDLEVDGQTVSYISRQWDSEAGTFSEELGEMAWGSLVQGPGAVTGTLEPSLMGRVRIRLMFVPRRPDVAARAGLSPLELRHFLDQNTGVRIYRDRIRVRPYGEANSPEGDWLGLAERKTQNPAGPSRPDFRVSPGQVVGAVFIGRDTNPELIDSAAREGFLEGVAFSTLRAAGTGAIRLLEAKYHAYFNSRKEREEKKEEADPANSLQEVIREIDSITESLVDSSRSEKVLSDEKSDVRRKLGSLKKRVRSARKAVLELLSDAGTLRGLSTIGIANSTFGHEVRSSVAQILASAETARAALDRSQPRVAMALAELGALNTHTRRLDAWASFALTRVRRDKRTRNKLRVDAIVAEVVDEMRPMLESSGVSVEATFVPAEAWVFAMDIETIVINLLTNAYTALRTHGGSREIIVSARPEQRAGKAGVELVVADSGPGIPDEYVSKVWRPLFTTKVDENGRAIGTGLGLSIVASIMEECRGAASISKGTPLPGAVFTIWIPTERT